jgi:hypothetical protein
MRCVVTLLRDVQRSPEIGDASASRRRIVFEIEDGE